MDQSATNTATPPDSPVAKSLDAKSSVTSFSATEQIVTIGDTAYLTTRIFSREDLFPASIVACYAQLAWIGNMMLRAAMGIPFELFIMNKQSGGRYQSVLAVPATPAVTLQSFTETIHDQCKARSDEANITNCFASAVLKEAMLPHIIGLIVNGIYLASQDVEPSAIRLLRNGHREFFSNSLFLTDLMLKRFATYFNKAAHIVSRAEFARYYFFLYKLVLDNAAINNEETKLYYREVISIFNTAERQAALPSNQTKLAYILAELCEHLAAKVMRLAGDSKVLTQLFDLRRAGFLLRKDFFDQMRLKHSDIRQTDIHEIWKELLASHPDAIWYEWLAIWLLPPCIEEALIAQLSDYTMQVELTTYLAKRREQLWRLLVSDRDFGDWFTKHAAEHLESIYARYALFVVSNSELFRLPVERLCEKIRQQMAERIEQLRISKINPIVLIDMMQLVLRLVHLQAEKTPRVAFHTIKQVIKAEFPATSLNCNVTLALKIVQLILKEIADAGTEGASKGWLSYLSVTRMMPTPNVFAAAVKVVDAESTTQASIAMLLLRDLIRENGKHREVDTGNVCVDGQPIDSVASLRRMLGSRGRAATV